jgi:sarcosine oxidase subunit alpha
VLLIEQTRALGRPRAGRWRVIDGLPAEDWVEKTVAELAAMRTSRMRTRCMGAGVYDHGYVLAYERLTRPRARGGARATGSVKIRAGRSSPPPAPSSAR